MRYYPIFLDLQGRRCVVVGGGRVAERKVLTLLRAGASVHVISPTVTARLARLAEGKKIRITPRNYRHGDFAKSGFTGTGGARAPYPTLVFAATDDPETQRSAGKDAKGFAALVNVADDPRECDFIVPASFAQGDLLVAISTSGASPALARRLRRELQLTLGSKYRGYLRFLREVRKQIKATVPDKALRAQIFRQLSGTPLMDWFWQGKRSRKGQDVKGVLAKAIGMK